MARKLEIFKCFVCGHVVEVVHGGNGDLWCCGRPMTLFSEKTVDREREEHFPVVERSPEGVKVTVGSEMHAMEEDHHIQWIEVIADKLACRQFLSPGDAPEATFQIPSTAETIHARVYCTQHGLCVER